MLLGSCYSLDFPRCPLFHFFPGLKACCPSAFGIVCLCLPGVIGQKLCEAGNQSSHYSFALCCAIIPSSCASHCLDSRKVLLSCLKFQVGDEVSNCMIKRQNYSLINLALSFLANVYVKQRGETPISFEPSSDGIALTDAGDGKTVRHHCSLPFSTW